MKFTEQPEPAVISIVKEFYINAKETQWRVVLVRGKPVSYDAESINAYYNLPNIEKDDELMTYKLESFNLGQMLATLGRPGAIWTRKGGVIVHFSHMELNRNTKAWYYFLCAKLLPTTHVSDVIKDCALVLFAIVTGKSINVGTVIKDSILYAIQGSSIGGLSHPSLICGLCKETQVRWTADETLIQLKALIN